MLSLPLLPKGVAIITSPFQALPQHWGKAMLTFPGTAWHCCSQKNAGEQHVPAGLGNSRAGINRTGGTLHHRVHELPGAASIMWKVVQIPVLVLQWVGKKEGKLGCFQLSFAQIVRNSTASFPNGWAILNKQCCQIIFSISIMKIANVINLSLLYVTYLRGLPQSWDKRQETFKSQINTQPVDPCQVKLFFSMFRDVSKAFYFTSYFLTLPPWACLLCRWGPIPYLEYLVCDS